MSVQKTHTLTHPGFEGKVGGMWHRGGSLEKQLLAGHADRSWYHRSPEAERGEEMEREREAVGGKERGREGERVDTSTCDCAGACVGEEDIHADRSVESE